LLPLLATKTREKVIIADSSDLRINDCKTAFKQNSLQRLTKERQRNTERETETEKEKELRGDGDREQERDELMSKVARQPDQRANFVCLIHSQVLMCCLNPPV